MASHKYVALLILLILSSCKKAEDRNHHQYQIVTTTNILADAVKALVRDSAEVESLMAIGVDPHLYKTSQRDLDKLFDADLVIYQGFYLEGKMNEVLKKFARTNQVLSVESYLSPELLLKDEAFENSVDPHLWFDPVTWKEVMRGLAEKLIHIHPGWEAYLLDNLNAYEQQMEQLDVELKEKINRLPADKRILVTAHDAFAYFGKAYGFEVKGLQGLSTLSEPGLNDVTRLVQYISEHRIKAIFSEQSISPRGVKALVEGCRRNGHEVTLAGPLYTDSLGEPDGPAGTYLRMLRYNMEMIVENLR
ncbi:metal ABC transporter solute-binding protein, Zn/Mn family [Anditalea andensis]|nr:zinc ABC transporter substrate-binding protein [Anditalea andensis]